MTSFIDLGSEKKEWIIGSEAELEQWVEKFAGLLSSDETILLNGSMGSGKTTFVTYLMKALKGEEASSPTFSLVNEYHYPEGTVFHFDLYRLDEPDELEEIGFEEYLDREAICLIEWPDLGARYYIDEGTITISIEVLPDKRRKIKWKKGIDL